ncbi:MAG TPA: YdcF family protein [Anaerolineae bacterium]|nr:YdcF family protein [Anaerolineae bacterium]
MFIILSKLLPLFIYPLGLTCILLSIALLVKNKKRLRVTLIAAALLILWLSSTSFIADNLARSLEWRYLPPEEIPQADAIVVLGGGTEPASYPRLGVEVNSAGDRVLTAAELFRQGKAPNILLSGGKIAWLNSGESTPAEEMAEILEFTDVPRSSLWLEKESQNTHENAAFSKAILQEHGAEEILLVTSAIHMPRAVALFEEQGFKVVPVPVDYAITDSTAKSATLISTVLDFLPSASNLALTTNALKEYLGMLTYHLQGWL